MFELFTLPFMQKAMIGGILVALLSSYYGVFLVQRKMSFLGSGLAHAAFGGVALGLLLKAEPLWVALPFTIVVSLMITWVHHKSRVEADSAVGIFFSTSMALGIVFMTFNNDKSSNALTYLFGTILAIEGSDLFLIGALLLITLSTLHLWGRWAYASFDHELARSEELPVYRDDYILSTLLAVNIVVSIKIMGLLLVSAFLVIPPATARLVARSFSTMTIYSIVIGVSTTLIGLMASYSLDAPSGATIILVQALLFFFFALGAKSLFQTRIRK